MRVPALLTTLVLLAAGCGSESDEAAPTSTAGDAPSSAASSRPAAPVIDGATLDGELISLADFRGRPVFVNVWSSW